AFLAVLWTNTADVQSVVVNGVTIWAATSGGLEAYTFRGTRTSLYTTEHGLDSNMVHEVWAEGEMVRVRTERSVCVLREDRFGCAEALGFVNTIPAVAPRVHGARETARLTV